MGERILIPYLEHIKKFVLSDKFLTQHNLFVGSKTLGTNVLEFHFAFVGKP